MNSSNKTVLAIHCFFKLAPVFHSLIVFFFFFKRIRCQNGTVQILPEFESLTHGTHN